MHYRDWTEMALANSISNECGCRIHSVHELEAPIAAGHDRQERVAKRHWTAM